MALINHHTMHIVTAGSVALLLIILSWVANRRLKKTEACLVPQDKLTPATFFEVVVEALLGLMEGVLGEKAQKFFPLIGSLFIYILFCNMIGLIRDLPHPLKTSTRMPLAR